MYENEVESQENTFFIHHVAVVLRGTRTSIWGETNQKGTNTLLEEKYHSIALKYVLKGLC